MHTLFYVTKYGVRKILYENRCPTKKDLTHAVVTFLETSAIDDLGNLMYSDGFATYILDYYNFTDIIAGTVPEREYIGSFI